MMSFDLSREDAWGRDHWRLRLRIKVGTDLPGFTWIVAITSVQVF